MISEYILLQSHKLIPWQSNRQIEQDLVISRALVELYNVPELRESLAFRGGTALNKIYFKPAARYSEDLDFVQIKDEPIGATLGYIRSVLDPWLGQARWDQKPNSARLIYRFHSDDAPIVPMRLKIEINTVEPFSVYGFELCDFTLENEWFSGKTKLLTYKLEELMATKLRALYQRLKGRDLFDLYLGITQLNMDCKKVVDAFLEYNNRQHMNISRAQFEANLYQKKANKTFISDMSALLPFGQDFNVPNAFDLITTKLVALLPGEPWKNTIEIAYKK